MFTALVLICSGMKCTALVPANEVTGARLFKTQEQCQSYIEENINTIDLPDDVYFFDAQCVNWSSA